MVWLLYQDWKEECWKIREQKVLRKRPADETVRKSTHCEDISVHVNAHQGRDTTNRLFKWKKINRVAILEG